MRYAPPGMCLNDFAVIGDGPYHLLHLQGPWTDEFDATRHETSYGRAHSTDLVQWEPLGAAFGVGRPGRFDESAVWTMHPFNHGAGMAMAYTGVRRVPHPEQSIGLAFSNRTDGTGWRRSDAAPIRPDHRWYRLGPDEAWRDPWVIHRPEPGIEYAMVVAARVAGAPPSRAGCVGLATSDDLAHWQVLPPILVPRDVNELECPVLEPLQDGGWLLLGSIGPEREIRAWRSHNLRENWVALGPIAPPGPYAPRIVAGPAGERLVLHTVPRRIGLRDDGLPCRGMLAQPKVLDVSADRARLRWWPPLERFLNPPVAPDTPLRDLLVEVDLDGDATVVIRDDGGPDAIHIALSGSTAVIRSASGRVLQKARLDQPPAQLRILAVGEYIEVYADDLLGLSTTSYASGAGGCRTDRPRQITTVRPVAALHGTRDDISVPWVGR